MLVHKGAEFEKAGSVPAFDPNSDPEEWGVILERLRNFPSTSSPSTTSGFSQALLARPVTA
jgi:adenosylhomocysteinase